FRDLTQDRHLDVLKSEFVATVSLELRTPLTAVCGAAMTLRRADLALEDAQCDHLLAVLVREAERLSMIVDDILKASRIESEALELSIRSCDGVELARAAVEEAEA